MSDIICSYAGDREGMLMAYLYEEIAPPERQTFEAHLATCARCRVELHALGGVRSQLARWAPPVIPSSWQLAVGSQAVGSQAVGTESDGGRVVSLPLGERSVIVESLPATRAGGSWWREMPAWAQVAAAMLVVGVSAGIANLNVHYDGQSGLNIRTGWATAASPSNLGSPANANAVSSVNPVNFVSRDDLTKLEQQLREEIQSQPAGAAAMTVSAPGRSATDAEVVRRIKSLVDESERRQQRELALRVGELMREVNMQRQADLRKIDQNLGLIQDKTGVEVLRNRQMIDLYMQRVSQRQ